MLKGQFLKNPGCGPFCLKEASIERLNGPQPTTNNKMNYLDQPISIYKNVRGIVGRTCTLRSFLFSTKYKERILEIRAIEDKKARDILKIQLPQATISGVFKSHRKAENLVKHSGLICIDIDDKDNRHILNFDDLKKQLANFPEMLYIGHSVGGKGFFCILPLKYPEKHLLQFKQLQIDFSKVGIIIDSSCSDVSRLRCISLDEEPYVNEKAIPYRGLYYEPVKEYSYRPFTEGDTVSQVYQLCIIIEQNHIDLTNGYNNWFHVGASLCSLGEEGREAFHICSRQNEQYKHQETDKMFDRLLINIKRIGIGTFFHLCEEHGLFPNNLGLK